MKNTFLYLLFFFITASISSQIHANEPTICIATTPKAGTHLLFKLLQLLDIKPFPSICLGDIKHHLTHYLKDNIKSTDIHRFHEIFPITNKYIVMLRDPRDFFISHIHWKELQYNLAVFDDPHHKVYKENVAEYIALPIELKLHWAICNETPEKYEKFCGWQWVIDNYNILTRLMQFNWNHILFIRFEDLIGPLGQGNAENQFIAIRKIAQFCGKEISDDEIMIISSALWGGTTTFRESSIKIGQWKLFFNDLHLTEFKERYNNLLINLGYENDPNWTVTPPMNLVLCN